MKCVKGSGDPPFCGCEKCVAQRQHKRELFTILLRSYAEPLTVLFLTPTDESQLQADARIAIAEAVRQLRIAVEAIDESKGE